MDHLLITVGDWYKHLFGHLIPSELNPELAAVGRYTVVGLACIRTMSAFVPAVFAAEEAGDHLVRQLLTTLVDSMNVFCFG